MFSMNTSKRISLAVVAALALTGCASVMSKGNFQPRIPVSGESTVYMMRPYHFEATMLPVGIRLDGQSIGSLTLNEGIYLRLPAGKHTLAVDPPIGQLPWSFPVGDHEFSVEAGKQYVVSLATSVVGSAPERSTVSAVYVGGRIGVMPVFGKDGGLQKGARWDIQEFEEAKSKPELLKIGFRESR